jgi:hypothetical protein
MANRMSEAVSTSREDDLAFEDFVGDAEELPSRSNDESKLDFVAPELKAESTEFFSIHDSNGADQILEALQRRLRGVPIGSCASERIALSLDLGSLSSDELETMARVGDDIEPTLRSVVLVGLLSGVFPAIEEMLLELGITRQQVHEDWAQQLDQEIQERTSAFLADNEYKSACRLTEFKTKHLYASLSTLARERRDRDGVRPRETSGDETDAAKADMQAAVRDAQSKLAKSGPRSWVAAGGNIVLGEDVGQKIRGGVAAVAALCILTAVGLNLINAETPDTTNLRPRELSDISRYLKTAYRNGNGSGALVIGQVDEDWHALSNELKVEAAEAMKIRLAEEKVRDAMIYDSKRQIQIHVASGKVRRPLLD